MRQEKEARRRERKAGQMQGREKKERQECRGERTEVRNYTEKRKRGLPITKQLKNEIITMLHGKQNLETREGLLLSQQGKAANMGRLREGGDTGSTSERRAGKTARQVDSLADKPGPRPQGAKRKPTPTS